jgi:hypothetical protein
VLSGLRTPLAWIPESHFNDNSDMAKKVFDACKVSAQVESECVMVTVIPLVQGVSWNEVIDELALGKSDFKGQKPADKIITVYKELQNTYRRGFHGMTMEFHVVESKMDQTLKQELIEVIQTQLTGTPEFWLANILRQKRKSTACA